MDGQSGSHPGTVLLSVGLCNVCVVSGTVSLDLQVCERTSGWVRALLLCVCVCVCVCVRLAWLGLLSQRKADQDRAAQLQPLAPKTMNVSSF